MSATNAPVVMFQVPKKRGRPRLYSPQEKARRDVVNRRLRRQAKSAAKRQNTIRFQNYTAEQIQPVPPPIPHQVHLQSLDGLNVLADTASYQVTTSQPRKLPDPGYQTREDVLNCFDDDDDISPPDLSSTHDATPNEDSNLVLAIEQPTGLMDVDTDVVSDGISGQTEGGLSRPQQDGNTSGQEEGGLEEDSDLEFVTEDIETDSDSEADLSPDEEAVADEDISYSHSQSHRSLAKSFLENTWNHLYDCENEDSSLESGKERAIGLKQMAEYWQNLGVPDAIGSTALPPEAAEEERQVDWFSILSGGEQRPHLRLETLQENAPIINCT
ncbi:hypothetical protein OIDMADRAFT_61797 [Oidiodendron maius Zn]|uniref:Uncharacterized protein n=1 Tax=Oidiodendron maius (strain Zn) TaxID=913774 RepID=A0A0C3GPG4_OIDMZ|nr:hypothetical protein OIDMADRAFT_61797 [Oidiodendron maius Zn]